VSADNRKIFLQADNFSLTPAIKAEIRKDFAVSDKSAPEIKDKKNRYREVDFFYPHSSVSAT
jgi:hypothetical protein